MKKTEETNEVKISGTILDELKMDHNVQGERIYKTNIRVKRRSDEEDHIETLIPEKLLIKENIFAKMKPGSWIKVKGILRTQNIPNKDGRKSLRVFVLVSKIEKISVEDKLNNKEDINIVYIDGYLCKEPFYKKTNSGMKITKLDIAVNRACNESDYIPSIVWDELAKFSSFLKVGAHVKCYGRIQSRKYFKFRNWEDKFVDFSQLTKEQIEKLGEWKETWELSIFKLKVISW